MFDIIFKDVYFIQLKEVKNLFLKRLPNFFFFTHHLLNLFTLQHGETGNFLDELFFWLKFGSRFLHVQPSVFDCLLFRSDLQRLEVCSDVDQRVGDDELPVLNHRINTKSSSSQQSKWRWCRTPFGNVLSNPYSWVVLMSSKCRWNSKSWHKYGCESFQAGPWSSSVEFETVFVRQLHRC